MAKPAFDPNKPFEVTGSSNKPKFDPSKPFEIQKNSSSINQNEEPDDSEESGPLMKAAENVGSYALEKAAQAGRFIDRYTGAPIRAGIGDAQTTDNPLSPLKAIYNQFGEDPERAPTGKQIAQKMGVPDTSLSDKFPEYFTTNNREAKQWLKFKKGGPADITASGVAGLGYDIAADPTLLLPGKALTKGAELVADSARVAAKGAKAVTVPVAELASNGIKNLAVKAGKTLTGVPEKNIIKYIENTDEINKIISKHGGDMTLAADELRESLQNSIQKKVLELNKDIKTAIDSAPAGSAVSNSAIIEGMEKVKSGINPKLYPDSIKEIEALIEKIKSISTGEASSEVGAKAANDAKRFLQDMGKGAYLKDGQIFRASDDAAKAAKAGAREARKAEMALAPETIQPNKDLARLHRYQDGVNKNLIAPGKTESALLAAGAGENARNAKNLRDISELTGFDALGEAEKVSAAKTFANPGWIPMDATGKSGARMALGAFLGSFLGPKGAAVGIALTSPQTLKMAINSGNISKKFVSKLAGVTGELTDAALKKAVEVARTEEGLALIKSMSQSKEFGINEINAVAENDSKDKKSWAKESPNQRIKKMTGEKKEAN